MLAALELEGFTLKQVTDFEQPRARAWANVHLRAAAYKLGGNKHG
jgi:hypothetical protein